jgi:nicotinate-nucleotide--dimethylbenzimidazole phosphoribosyltransferase
MQATIGPLDAAAMAAVRAHLDRLTKPPGSLGRLERLVEQLAGISGSPTPRVDRPAVVVFAGDHGVTARGVSAYPSDVTAQMVANFVGGGAAINVLADAAGAELVVVDVGVSGDGPPANSPAPGAARLVRARIAAGTRDMTVEPAMRRDEALAAIDVGRRIVEELVSTGVDTIAVGEMGIGNTTAASALVAALTDLPPAAVTGRGTGLDAEAVRHKVDVIEAALRRHHPRRDDPIGALAAVGGLEIAALVGAILATAEVRTPVVLDGFITGAAALVAATIAPALGPRLIASHRSPEPGHAVVLPVIRSATLLLAGMATFDSAGVSGPLPAAH